MSAEEEKAEPTQVHQEEKSLEELVKEQQEALRLQDECIRLQQEHIGLLQEKLRLQEEHIHLRDERINTYEREFVILRHMSSDLSIQVQQLQDRMEKDGHNSHQTFSGHRLHQPTKGLRKKGKKKPGRS